MTATATVQASPPRDDLVRAMPAHYELRATVNGDRPVMHGHFAVFDQWAEIDSVYEGHFLERVAPGAFAKTIAENRKNMRVLFHHGMDQLGLQVLGSIDELREDEQGAYYEVSLFDGIPQLVLDGLRAGEYGSSYRFAVVRDEYVLRPRRGDHNPDGLPERTITEAKVREFGPTPFPAFHGASSGVRSATDDFLLERLAHDPERFDQIVKRSGISLAGLHTPERGEDHHKYRRAADYVAETVWAIHPAALATILEILNERRSGYRPTEEEIRERIGNRDAAAEPKTSEPTVAVLNLFGSIFPKANLMTELSGASSIEAFRSEFRDALASEDVKAILLNIDSPGGSGDQVPEMAAEILAARGVKPIVAQANGWAASAAYWIASAADELIVTPSGQVGSIGVWTAHDDISAMQEKAGIKTTLVSAGDYKVEGNPYEPLSEDAQAEMQRKVDAFYEMFVAAVAKGRGVTPANVKTDFGQGRMVLPADAVTAGMADRVASIDDTIARLAKAKPSARSTESTGSTGSEPSVATTRREPEPSVATTPKSARKPRTNHDLTSEEGPAWLLPTKKETHPL